MNKILRKILLCSLVLVMGCSVLYTSSIYAMEKKNYEEKLNETLGEVLKERELHGEASEEGLKKLENILGKLDVQTNGSKSGVSGLSGVTCISDSNGAYCSNTVCKGNSGKWIEIDSNWKYRIDGPHTGPDTAKYHVHVEGKDGNKKIKSSEGVDGTISHKKTMNGSRVPKWVQKKIKASKKFKEAKKKQKQIKKAKEQIKSQKLNLKKATDILIAIGIFISVVGIAILAGASIPAWGAFLACI